MLLVSLSVVVGRHATFLLSKPMKMYCTDPEGVVITETSVIMANERLPDTLVPNRVIAPDKLGPCRQKESSKKNRVSEKSRVLLSHQVFHDPGNSCLHLF